MGLRLEEHAQYKENVSRAVLVGGKVLPAPPEGPAGGIPLPDASGGEFALSQEALARGLLAIGATGSGKTNLILTILDAILRSLGREDTVIIFDAKQDFANAFYSAGNPDHILISPAAEEKGRSWNLFWELFPDGAPPLPQGGIQSDILELSAALFAPLENQQQPFFHLAARDVFRMAVSAYLDRAARAGTDRSLRTETLIDFLDRCTTKSLLDLTGPEFGYLRSYLGSPEMPTPQSLGVEGTLHAMTAGQFLGSFRRSTAQGDFAIRRLVREKGGKVVFVEHDLSRGEALGPILSVLFDLAVKEQLAGGKGKLYLFLDELSVMPHIRRLSDACNLGRSRGLRTVAGLQSVEMLRSVYGEAQAGSILAGFVNAVCFKAVDAATRDYISGRFGRTLEVLPYGGSYVPHEGFLVGDTDMRSLHPGEAFCDFFGQPPFRMQFRKF